MAEVLKVLGQQIPAAATLTALYTAAAVATVSSLVACNESVSAATIRISVAVAGAGDDPKQYLYFDLPLAANDSFAATLGITLSASDVVRCQSSNGQVAFNLFGVEG